MERKGSFELISDFSSDDIITELEDESLEEALAEVGSLTETIYISTTEKNRFEKFCFDGLYENKKERILMLKQSFINLGFSGEYVEIKECFLCRGFKLNCFETESIVHSLKGRFFYFLVKFFHLQQILEDVKFCERQNVLLEALKWPVPKFLKQNSKEKKAHKTKLFGDFFQLNCRDLVFLSIIRATNVLSKIADYEAECIWDLEWCAECNRSRYRFAKHILKNVSDENKTLETFLLRHNIQKAESQKRVLDRREEEEEKFQKKAKLEAVVVKSKPDETVDLELSDEASPLERSPLASEDEVEKDIVLDVIGGEEKQSDENSSPENPPVRKKASQIQKLIEEYKKVFNERRQKVSVNKKTWAEIIVWSIAIFAIDLLARFTYEFSYYSGVEVDLVVILVGVLLVFVMVSHPPHYVSTILTLAYIRFVDGKHYVSISGEIYAVVALQVLALDKIILFPVPAIGYAIYAIWSAKEWFVCVHYLITFIVFLKGHRMGDAAKSILVAPYSTPILVALGILQIAQLFSGGF